MLLLRACVILTSINLYYFETKIECGQNCVVNEQNTLICTDVPACVPEGIVSVEVADASGDDQVIITASNFTGKNWNKVLYFRIVDTPIEGSRHWIISNATFVAMESIVELHINIKRLYIHDNSLEGLSAVKLLDFTDCERLTITKLGSLLNGTTKLTGLQEIVLSNINQWVMPYDFDDKLIDVLLPRNITDIDVSNTYINVLNFTAILKRMKYLQSFNLSYSTTSLFFSDFLKLDDIYHLRILDISRWTLPNRLSLLPIKYAINDDIFYLANELGNNIIQLFSSLHVLNATGIVKSPTILWLSNVTIVATIRYHFLIKQLEFKENNLNRLDVRINNNDNVTLDLEYMGLSSNDLEFLHYSVLSCMPNLKILDLSRNKLSIMYDEDPMQFGQLLSGVPALTYIDLSNNSLIHIPREFFSGSQMLTTIDLSYNKLTQVTFSTTKLRNLRILELRSNNIKTLDAESLQNLKYFPSHASQADGNRIVNFASNPISCSECDSKPFLKWLLSTKFVDTDSQGLHCIDEHGNRVAIRESIVNSVQSICIRKTITISVTVSITSLLTLATVILVLIYKRRKRANIFAHRRAVVDKIQEGEGQYKFIVFFSYCSKDETFAMDIVMNDLKDNLRVVTGIEQDRNPVCTGDTHLRPGFYVHDEVDARLDESSAVVVLATDDYCLSQYCGSELEKAFMKNKPIVLMFKDHVREELMSRTMRDLYRRKVRILWAEEDGEYKLLTTWENVCTSIIDLIN